MKRSFDEVMNNLKTTIASYDYFVDFNKVLKNVDSITKSIDKFETLIDTKEEFDNKFMSLINSDPSVLRIIPILLATRTPDYQINVIDGVMISHNFSDKIDTNEKYLLFMRKTGLRDLIAYGRIKSIKDYLIGVEVGLDSNARKNRTGTAMESIVYNYLSKFKDIQILKQASKRLIKEEFGFEGLEPLDLSEGKGKKRADKRFDFAVKYKKEVFLIETNFYGGGGSKLNETARSYQELADQINTISGCQFIWITDGVGWRSAKNNLKESYEHQNHLLTIQDLEFDNLIKLIREYSK